MFVADRSNSRVQIFDQDGNFIAAWKQFGRPSAVFVGKDDTLYVSDSQSNSTVNPGFTRGITIGSAKDGSLTAFIPDPDLDQADVNRISGASGIVADAKGTIYAADVGPAQVEEIRKGQIDTCTLRLPANGPLRLVLLKVEANRRVAGAEQSNEGFKRGY